MCQHIVGTEEQVKTVRMMNTVRDDLRSNNDWTVITSGSFGDGLQMRGSDLDIMMAIKCIEVCEDTNIPFNPDAIYLAIETEDTQPGFTKLRILNCNDQSFLKDCEKIGIEHFFVNSFKEVFLNKFITTIHGPCLTDNNGTLDYAICTHCKSWITPANQWITRSNNSWPGYDVKQAVVKHGVLFVPIGVKGSLTEELEWRISFSVAEKFLIYTFTQTQLLCYALMKILLKDVIARYIEYTGFLCSYVIKTVMFWISEDISTSIWKPENLLSCFMRCFKRLIYCVEYSVCPHYFIPENNLFANKIEIPAHQVLLNKLYSLNSYGWQCILFSDQISNFNDLSIDSRPRCLPTDFLKLFLSPTMFQADEVPMTLDFKLTKGIQRILSNKSSKIKYLYTYYISKYCQKSDQFLQVDYVLSNKSTYTKRNACISTLLLTTRHDALSGWLLLASFYHKTKQYNSVLRIIQYALSKCSSRKPPLFARFSNIFYELSNLDFSKKITVAQLRKLMLLGFVTFSANSVLIPDELQMEEDADEWMILPILYALFLQFLSHFHLKNTKQYRDSFRNLQLTIQNHFQVSTFLMQALHYKILGISFHLIQDTESA